MEEDFLVYFDKEWLLGSDYSSYGDLLKECVTINAISMQSALDINPNVIKEIFEHYSFVEYCKTMLEKMINTFKVELKIKSMQEYPQEYYLNSKLKTENCGYVKKCYVNGYIAYCNVHKYEHQDEDEDHSFIYKTPTDAMKEYNNNIKYFLYQEFVTLLCTKIKHYVEDVIKTSYLIYETTSSKEVINWLKSHPKAFKVRTKNENKITVYLLHNERASFNKCIENHRLP